MLGGRLRIEVVDRDTGDSQTIPVDPSEASIQVGRDRSSRIVLTSPSVSRKHCVIETDGRGWAVTDTSSLGTRLNGRNLARGEKTPVGDGDRIEIANYELKVQLLPATDPTIQSGAAALQQMIEAAGEEVVHPRIWVFLDPNGAKEYLLPEEGASLTVGRGEECSIQLPDPMRTVSTLHAKIERSWAGVFLYDTSTNGVFVNGKRVTEAVALTDEDRITIAAEEEGPDRPLLVFTDEGNRARPAPPRSTGRAPGGAFAGTAGGASAMPGTGAGAGAAAGAGPGVASPGDGGWGAAQGASRGAEAWGPGQAASPGRGRIDGAGGSGVGAEAAGAGVPARARAGEDAGRDRATGAPAPSPGAPRAAPASRVPAAGEVPSDWGQRVPGAKINLFVLIALIAAGLALLLVIIWAVVIILE
jgi:pSer/pThr/pTyr-binding forkhead associated (FHA) protein